MISTALAILAAAAPLPQPAARSADDADVRCVAAVSFAIGAATTDKSIDAEGMNGLTAVFMYFLGKVDARRPDLDYAKVLGGLMNAPGYGKELPADLARCGKEAEARGTMLQHLGEELKQSTPLTDTRPG